MEPVFRFLASAMLRPLPLTKLTWKRANMKWSRDLSKPAEVKGWVTKPTVSLHKITSPYLVFLVLFVTVIISGQLMAAQGAGICLEKSEQYSSPFLLLIPTPALTLP